MERSVPLRELNPGPHFSKKLWVRVPTLTTLNTTSQDWILSTIETLPAHDLLPQIFKSSSRKTLRKDVPELLNSVDLQELDPTLVDLLHVDPALCLYVGAHVLYIIDNVNLVSKAPRGNGKLCHVIGIKLKDNAQSCRWKKLLQQESEYSHSI